MTMAGITGKDLIAWGFEPGPWFNAAIVAANLARRRTRA
jgi:hypothetical protein